MSTHFQSSTLPSTPPRATKRHLTAPALQRAGHASLTFQYPPRLSALSSGLLPSPTSPFDDPTPFSEENTTQGGFATQRATSRKINSHSFVTVLKPRNFTRRTFPVQSQNESTIATPTLDATRHLLRHSQHTAKVEGKAKSHNTRQSSSSAPTTDRSAASSRLSRHSALSDTSKTLLALFPLPPKLGHSLLDSSSPETSAGPKTPSTYLQNDDPSLEIELDELTSPTEPYSPLSSLQARTKSYTLPRPPLRQNKPLPMLPQRSFSEQPRITPPRAIFSDYTTAFQAIRSKSTKDLHDVSNTRDLPLPPVPAKSPARYRLSEESNDNQGANPDPELVPATFRRKMAKILGPQSRRDVMGKLSSQKQSKTLTYSTQTLVGRKRVPRPTFDALARFSMPEVSVLHERDARSEKQGHAALIHSSSSDPSSSAPSSSTGHDSEHGSPSTNRGSQDSAERFVDSYIKRDMLVRKPSFRRYSALPRLQNIRSDGSVDGTTSTIGDILSQYGEPEFRSLPASMSQRLPPLESEHHPSRFPSHASLFSVAGDLHEEETPPDVVAKVLENPFEASQGEERTLIKRPPPAVVTGKSSLRATASSELRLNNVESSTTPLVDYGDTRDLLQLSSSSIDVDVGRGNVQDRLSLACPAFSDPTTLDMESSSETNDTIDQLITSEVLPLELVPPSSDSAKHVSDLGFKQLLLPALAIAKNRNLESFLAESSNDSTATTTTITKSDNGKDMNPFRREPVSAPEPAFVLPADPMSDQLAQYFAEQHSASQIKLSAPAVRQSALAAFAPSDVLPAAYRSSPSKELKRREPSVQHVDDVDIGFQAGNSDDEGDWETVAESHRTGPGYKASLRSVAGSDSTSHNIPHVGIHPADRQYKHIYRLHSPPGSAESILVPSYDMGGSAGFPYINASHTSSHHPLYQRSHENNNPFRAAANFSQTTIESVSFDEEDEEEEEDRPVPYGLWRGRTNLSIVYEQSGERSSATELGDNHVLMAPSIIATAPSRIGSTSTVESSSAWVSCGPGPEISSADGESAWQHGQESQPLRTRPSSFLASGADASLVKSIRRNPSSPTSSTSNTFNKMSRLGPHGNITGSINGTNMRLVGSSIAGSSSPLASPPRSTHSVQQTPKRLEAPQPALERTSSLVEESSSMSSWHRPRSYMIPKAQWKQQVPKIRPSSKHAVQLLSPTTGENYSRTAVASQKALMELNLAGTPSPNILNNISRPERQHDGSPSSPLPHTPQNQTKPIGRSVALDRMPDTLLPIAHPANRANIASPHLLRAYRPPSSTMEDINPKKQKISWICFAIFALFPPMLIFFGHGLADPIMWFLSGRRIEHFGARQKDVGKVVGYFVTGSIVIGLAVALVVIRTVPNSLPK